MKKNISQKKVVFNLPENKKFSQYKKHTTITKSEVIEKKSNIGIRTGKINNLTVIDIDTKDNGFKLYESWMNDSEKANSLKPVWKERTPSGGIHLYFNYDSSLKNLIKINEIISLIKVPTKTTKLKDSDLVDLLQYCDLVNELENANG